MSYNNTQNIAEALGIHRGAIDQETITTQSPPKVMKRVDQALMSMGVEVQVESEYRYRCIRPRRPSVEITSSMEEPTPENNSLEDSEITPKATTLPLPPVANDSSGSSNSDSDFQTINRSPTQGVAYGERTEEPGDEVRFSVELTRLNMLEDTYSLDIRRLKGNLRSYKFLYDTLKERASLQSY